MIKNDLMRLYIISVVCFVCAAVIKLRYEITKDIFFRHSVPNGLEVLSLSLFICKKSS